MAAGLVAFIGENNYEGVGNDTLIIDKQHPFWFDRTRHLGHHSSGEMEGVISVWIVHLGPLVLGWPSRSLCIALVPNERGIFVREQNIHDESIS